MQYSQLLRSVYHFAFSERFRGNRRVFGLLTAIRIALADVLGRQAFPVGKPIAAYPPTGGRLLARYGTSDELVFHTVFTSSEFDFLLTLENVETVIDLGANCGFSTVLFLRKFPKATVIAVEPDESNFRLLQENVKPFEGRVILINGAVWGERVPLRFGQNAYRGGDHWAQYVELAEKDDGSVFCWTIDDIVAEYRLSRIDFLKMDIEGAELNVFEKGGTWLSLVRNLAVELHDDTSAGSASGIFDQLFSQDEFTISESGEKRIAMRR